MNHLFDIHVSKNRLCVTLSLRPDVHADFSCVPQVLMDWLAERKIVSGYKHEMIQQICETPLSVVYPVLIAEGVLPQHGQDAYLMNEFHEQNRERTEFNFRNVLTIPSVKSGQFLARIIRPTPGIPGKDVYGNTIPARDGRQLRMKPGKNILIQGDQIFATTDGQISITPDSVNVFPVFEVKGDIDMKTGNVDFIGNVTIHGNVPAGYKIHAGGDIRISGLVEGANIEAGGSIHISGGVTGQLKGRIKAGVDVHTRYLNHANVEAGNDIVAYTFIMNSAVAAGRNILCPSGHIIGGKLSAGGIIEANDIGNHHFARADLFIGSFASIVEKESLLLKEISVLKDTLKKLEALKSKLDKLVVNNGKMESKELAMVQKQKDTYVAVKNQLKALEGELYELHEKHNPEMHGYLKVNGHLYPNNEIHFSKYSKLIHHPLNSVKLYLDHGEIHSVSL